MVTLLDNSTQKALTTLERAKAFLDIAGSSKDAILTLLINQASDSVERYTKRRMLRQTYTDEVYDGSGTRVLVLRQWPVASLTKLEVNSGTVGSPSWNTIQSDRYGWYEDGRIELASAFQAFLASDAETFLEGPKRYRATYAAGYLIDFSQENTPEAHTLPQELEYACLKLVSAVFNGRKAEGLASARVGDISMTYRKEVFADAELKEILGRHTAVTI